MATVNEKILDNSITDAVNLQRLTAKQRENIQKMLVKVEAKLRGKLAELPDLSKMSQAKSKKLINKYIKECETDISTSFVSFGKAYVKALAEISVYEAAKTAKNVNAAVEVSLVQEKVLTAEQAEVLLSDSWMSGKTMSEMLEGSKQAFINSFREQVRQGYMAGETNEQIMQRLKGYKDKNGVIHKGIADMNRRQAERMVRTSVISVSNNARWKFFEDNADILQGAMWVATLDERTCIECAERDGKVWNMDREPVDHDLPFEIPSIHPGCRCTLSPLIKMFGEIRNTKDLHKITQSTRASMDGQVPDSLDFETWFNRQSPERQREILGKGRYELWKAGKISFGDLIDQNGRALTVQELKEKYE